MNKERRRNKRKKMLVKFKDKDGVEISYYKYPELSFDKRTVDVWFVRKKQ